MMSLPGRRASLCPRGHFPVIDPVALTERPVAAVLVAFLRRSVNETWRPRSPLCVLRLVFGEESLLPTHLGPPQQHQHPPVCRVPAGRCVSGAAQHLFTLCVCYLTLSPAANQYFTFFFKLFSTKSFNYLLNKQSQARRLRL